MKLATINVVARHGRADADPVVVGIRQAVRFMRASIPRSTRQLKAAAAAATSQMPAQAASIIFQSCQPGTPGTASTGQPIRRTTSWIGAIWLRKSSGMGARCALYSG